MKNSYWFYLHPELTNQPHYHKAGRSLTPYSAVRSRQRFMLADFYLTAVWFGHPEDIAHLERTVHDLYRPSELGPGRRELIYYNPEQRRYDLETAIEMIIYSHRLSVVRRYTQDPRGYHAVNSSQCPFNCAAEKDAHEWSRSELWSRFRRRLGSRGRQFDDLFEYSN